MSTIQLRRQIKKAVDRVPSDGLPTLADFVEFLNRRALSQRLAQAEADFEAGKGVNWRKVRQDV